MIEETKQNQSSGLRWLIWIFAGVGLVGLLAIIFLAVLVEGSFNEPARAPVVTADGKEIFSVGQITPLSGSNIIAVDINSGNERGGYGSSGISKGSGSGDQRNVLLIDKVTGISSPILPDNSKRIGNISYLSTKSNVTAIGGQYAGAAAVAEGASKDRDKPVAYYLLEIAESKFPDGPFSLFAGTLATRKQGIVMKNIDTVESLWMLSATEVGMIVREKQVLYFRVVDIPELKLTKSVKIEIG
jgi:hypothetical protein